MLNLIEKIFLLKKQINLNPELQKWLKQGIEKFHYKINSIHNYLPQR